jgi:four helix bundle protein
MATVKTFEDFEIWQMSRALNKTIYKVTRRKIFNEDIDLRRQIRKASVSCMSNIAEGHERNNNNYFIQFLGIAKGSIGEVRSQLYSALDGDFIEEGEFHPLKEEATTIGKKIGALIDYLEKHREASKPRR